MTNEQIKGLRVIMAAIIDATIAGGEFGGPSGIIYAGLMAKGCSLIQFQSLTTSMKNAGLITQEGDSFFATQKGRDWAGMVGPTGGLQRQNLHGVIQ